MANLPGSFEPAPSTFPGPYSFSGQLPLGEWNMLANGRIYTLTISDVRGSRVEADMSSGRIQDAEWKDTASASSLATLTFTRVIDATGLKQRYHAYLLHYDRNDPLWRLVGTYGNVTVGEQAGWYATLPR
ncbi:MAG: hypothetical protein AAGM22_22915 [Acidobacteriota bacterium]